MKVSGWNTTDNTLATVPNYLLPSTFPVDWITNPEVLPAAMIRFASSVSIPPLRSVDTKIYWDSENCEHSLIMLYVQDERRWLRRRKRLGDTQR